MANTKRKNTRHQKQPAWTVESLHAVEREQIVAQLKQMLEAARDANLAPEVLID